MFSRTAELSCWYCDSDSDSRFFKKSDPENYAQQFGLTRPLEGSKLPTRQSRDRLFFLDPSFLSTQPAEVSFSFLFCKSVCVCAPQLLLPCFVFVLKISPHPSLCNRVRNMQLFMFLLLLPSLSFCRSFSPSFHY